MPPNPRRRRQARVLRYTRKLHRWSGLTLLLFFVIVGVTSVLLGLKKNVDYLMPPTQRVEQDDPAKWLTAETLIAAALEYLPADRDPKIDRLDFRPGKGIVKVTFKNHLTEIQLDATTGRLLSRGLRRADLIENIHDGSVVDNYFGWKANPFKVVYSTIMGLALLVFTASGFWLWYGPKRMRRSRSTST